MKERGKCHNKSRRVNIPILWNDSSVFGPTPLSWIIGCSSLARQDRHLSTSSTDTRSTCLMALSFASFVSI